MNQLEFLSDLITFQVDKNFANLSWQKLKSLIREAARRHVLAEKFGQPLSDLITFQSW